ncbi:TonB-dependent receptor [Chitinophagales bacterium]|nr:TonB-dependent receptor [Chitinophagales bacterium]
MRYLLLLCVLLSSFSLQAATVSGKVTDAETGEGLIGAQVKITETKGAITDLDGYYTLEVDAGEYQLICSYVGYDRQERSVTVGSSDVKENFKMKGQYMEVVTVTAGLARERETPVAFASISQAKIEEELGGRDLPMVLNSTPGVYATEQGGGVGDARVSIRGFDQRNIAVMVDGLPVNDMENGQVYWSNWAGLNAVTRSMQVQRGLGAAKIAIPSIGGTINIITKGIESDKGFAFTQKIGSTGLFTSELSATTGRLKNGWAITAFAAYQTGEGWGDELFSRRGTYFLKIDKEIGKHLISFTGLGAPQQHGQRTSKRLLTYHDAEHAIRAGVTDSLKLAAAENWGYRYNENWGTYRPYEIVNGDTSEVAVTKFNAKRNHFHKPQISLKDYWSISKRVSFSNIIYLSIGKGGGARLSTGVAGYQDDTGQLNVQSFYNANRFGLFSIDESVSATERKAGIYVLSSNNEHFWYGLLSTVNVNWENGFKMSIGIDARDYEGSHYRTPYDLIGGDYVVLSNDDQTRETSNLARRVGDKISYNNDAFVRWLGGFGQLEYGNGLINAFVNATWSYSGHKRVDYFRPMDLVLADTTIREAITFDVPYEFGDQIYTVDSIEAQYSTAPWIWLAGYTIKGGMNYNLDEHNNVYFNAGYYSKVPRFRNIFDFSNSAVIGVENEKIKAVEVGYGLKYSKFAANANVYYTAWENRPVESTPTVIDPDTEERLSYNINGMKARHQGVELDFIYKFAKKWEIEGLASLGDWIWNSVDTAQIINANQQLLGTVVFDAKGVHVGDAAQYQFGGSLRYEPFNGFYIKAQSTYFAKNYADFDPTNLTVGSGNESRDSWQIPDYYTVNLFAGYKFNWRGSRCSLNAAVTNLLNERYITDATNGSDFGPTTSRVYIGRGRVGTLSLKISI